MEISMNNNAAINQLLRELLLSVSIQQKKPKAKPKTNQKPSAKVQAAFEAVRSNDFSAAANLIRTPAEANYCMPARGWCLLDEAVKAGSEAMVRWLLARGANANTLFLNDRPCVPHPPYPSGLYFSPLATAINEAKVEIAELLLRSGASMDLPYWGHENGSYHTCFDLATDSEVWPLLEARLIAAEVPETDGPNTATSKRL
jgi:ankyrin repeat protein